MLDPPSTAQNGVESEANDGEEFTLMSIDTIINGKVCVSLLFSCIFCITSTISSCELNDTWCECFILCFFFKEGVFHGLIPMLNSYLENMEVDVDTRCTILNYLKLIKKRASGM